MARSGNSDDNIFAGGFLAGIVQDKSLHFTAPPDHWRPQAYLKSPLGQITGDIGLLIGKPPGATNTLLIVEREGSAPGNERNVLKWFEAVRGSYPIALVRGNQRVTQNFDRVILLQAFCRPSNWLQSDFQKTASFCEILATLVNQHRFVLGEVFTAIVRQYPTDVTDWRECGHYFGTEIIRQL